VPFAEEDMAMKRRRRCAAVVVGHDVPHFR
jgi:hypothetical protein